MMEIKKTQTAMRVRQMEPGQGIEGEVNAFMYSTTTQALQAIQVLIV